MWRLDTIRGFRSGQRRASMPWTIVCNQKKKIHSMAMASQVQVVVVVGHGVVVLIFASLYFFTFVLSAL
jgi:hypothetical protein